MNCAVDLMKITLSCSVSMSVGRSAVGSYLCVCECVCGVVCVYMGGWGECMCVFGGWGADGHTKLARNEQYICVICVCVWHVQVGGRHMYVRIWGEGGGEERG